MSEQEVFILADEALLRVVEQIGDEQWEKVLLPELTPRQPGTTLWTAVNYHACDDAWVPDVLGGKTIAEVGEAHDGDLLGAEPKAAFAGIVASAVRAVRAFTELDKVVHLSYGDYPAREYLKHISYFRGARVYDLARFIGADATLPADLVQGLWEELAPQAEEWRKLGVFGPAVAVAEDAPLQDRLLALTGRDPRR
ncbi:MAG: TIGR03086 family protein [Thermoleophilia bacterium]